MELALSAVQTVFAALQCSQLRDLLSVWGYKSELDSLDSTVETIRAVFSDADVMQAQGFELTAKQVDYIEKLKDAVYEADDLIDEFATLTAQHQQQLQNCTKVRCLLSRLGELFAVYEMSQELKNIRKKLDGIASDADKYSYKVDYQPIRKRREETCSYVYEEDIIGREDDKKRIIDMLLESNVQGDVDVIAIVGMGGLGKTALAQLVCNDPRIQKEFPLRLWVCVFDHDQNQFNVNAVLANIYKSMANPKVDDVDGLGLDLLVHKLREKLKQHKYLLVLDDLWTENHGDWLKLKGYLVGLGERGNKIVVTTRSKGTGNAVESNNPYILKALSGEDSWNLFERAVGKEQANRNDLVQIGKNIVKKCANIPLAIKVMGGLLHGQPVNKWQSIQQSRLTEIKNDGNDIIPILKLSYYHLSPSLKSCFTYCAMFPKDFWIQKEHLISLWMAHGYVKPLDEGQTIEEAAKEYFQILVRRCFFQDFQKMKGEIFRFKMHDLMHVMAQQASGKDIFIADSATTDLNKKTRHVYDSAPCGRTAGFITAATAKIRSYAQRGGRFGDVQFPAGALLENWRSIRVLDLSQLNITDLPDAIGELLHLRWLNLNGNEELKKLPGSLTKLINLQTLSVERCSKLEELPEDFSKLINLRTLYVTYEEDDGLQCMPLGMEKMTCLTRLNEFVLGQRKSSMKGRVRIEDLRVPKNLRGCLKISISPDYKHSKEYGGGGGYLCNTKYLKSVYIKWPWKHEEERMGNDDGDDDVLEDLQPHSTLKELRIANYPRLTIPSWAREDGLATSLPNLVRIFLKDCNGLKELPWLGKLQHLKTLLLENLKNLEYMENKTRGTNIDSSNDGAASSSMAGERFFCSLENLDLIHLPKLKGWWRGERLPLFPRLSRVRIESCPHLRSIPLGPAVETLFFRGSEIVEEDEDQKVVGGTSSNDSGNSGSDDPKIKQIHTSNVRFLKSLPMVAFQGLTKMTIWKDLKIQSLSEVEEVFHGCSSSLRFLEVRCCNKLRSISRGLQHLAALESLELVNLPAVSFDEMQGGMPWRCLAQCLRSLELCNLPKVVELPRGMRYLTALQSLKIKHLPLLKDLPEWITCLQSLHSLEIRRCEHLDSLPEALGNLTSLEIIYVPLFSEGTEQESE